KLADEITPEHRVVDISRLFEMRREEGLESAAREAQSAEIPKGTKEYQIFARTYEDYSQLKAFSGIVSVGGNLSDEQMAEVGKIGERVNIAEKYKTEGETVANILDASKAILYKFEKEKGFG
ncbi:MAG: hypothetical protein QGH34_03335, partial [Candidatus Woesearchaeota archaeon]|nr:hypothetical protein [Candidatus Woesearchaeota archaeon]